jgi:hypothetical protein
MDWYSRYVLSRGLSNTLEVNFCIEALEEALSQGQLEIFSSTKGASSPGYYWSEVSGLAWAGKVATRIISSWNDFGAALSMRRRT